MFSRFTFSACCHMLILIALVSTVDGFFVFGYLAGWIVIEIIFFLRKSVKKELSNHRHDNTE